MNISTLKTAFAGLTFGWAVTSGANAQAPAPIDINLSYVPYVTDGLTDWQLGIRVGIDSLTPGQGQRYLFDTGSSLFNVNYAATSAGLPKSTVKASSTLPNGGTNFTFSYGPKESGLGTVTGNLVHVRSITFSSPGANGNNGNVTLTAKSGYVVNAVALSEVHTDPNNKNFARLFDGTTYSGIFGAGNFAQNPQNTTFGGVLGQTIVSGDGISQGYVVAANGVSNVASSTNPPQGSSGITVTMDGAATPITKCSPCVMVGLTPQIIGQFAPVSAPSNKKIPYVGVVPVVSSGHFHNPYSDDLGNNSSIEFGAQFMTSITDPYGTTPVATTISSTLLDTGASLLLPPNLYTPTATTTTKSSDKTIVRGGVILRMTGLTTGGAPIVGLPTTAGLPTTGATLTNLRTTNTYNAGFYPYSADRPNNTRSGLWFFLQNSVMYDLTDNVIGYTPFFVTRASLSTPLTVDGTNVPLGLAAGISGTGGVTINIGGQLQLSDSNGYSGPTLIAAASSGGEPGQLYISGPGTIEASNGVTNNGLLDISRAWAPVAIQALSDAGSSPSQVNLGGQNLTITKANGTYSGTIGDSGTPIAAAYPGIGGSLTVAGGTQTLNGANTYTGATTIGTDTNGGSVGQLNLAGSGSIAKSSGVIIKNGTFDISSISAPVSIASLQSSSQGQANLGDQDLTITNANGDFAGAISSHGAFGSLIIAGGTQVLSGTNTYTRPTIVQSGASLGVNGSITSNVLNFGTLGGRGTITGEVVNGGTIAPSLASNIPSKLTIRGYYQQVKGSFLIQADAAGNASKIVIDGHADITDGNIRVAAPAGAPSKTYTILTASNLSCGPTLSATVIGGSKKATVNCDGQNLYLTLQ